jgi:hypothetical protein
MDFSELKPDDCMHTVAMDVAAELREAMRSLYVGMYQKNEDMQGAMPNVVLAGLSLLWLESAHTVFGTADYETALSLVKGIRPNDKEVEREMKQVARDFLRRSRWLPKRRRR